METNLTNINKAKVTRVTIANPLNIRYKIIKKKI